MDLKLVLDILNMIRFSSKVVYTYIVPRREHNKNWKGIDNYRKTEEQRLQSLIYIYSVLRILVAKIKPS